jgi:hypothetical protein
MKNISIVMPYCIIHLMVVPCYRFRVSVKDDENASNRRNALLMTTLKLGLACSISARTPIQLDSDDKISALELACGQYHLLGACL